MDLFSILRMILSIAAIIGRRLEEDKVRKAFGDALQTAIRARADAAVAAGSDIVSGRVPLDPDSPIRRD